MIRRIAGEHLILITQTSHAQLCGTLARRVGNAQFATPSPYEPVCGGIGAHDAGWEALDAALPLDAQGLPAHVFETPLPRVLPAWSASTRAAMALHPYAGLLVSLHGLGLSVRALMPHIRKDKGEQQHDKPGDDAVSPPRHSPHVLFETNRFQHAQIEIQEELRRQLQMRTDLPLKYGLASPGRSADEDLLLFNFRLLQWLDRLSLDLCFDRTCVDEVDPVYPRPGAAPVAMHIHRGDDGSFSVDPWPFGERSMQLMLSAKRMANRAYATSEEFIAALRDAPEVQVLLTLQGH